MFTFEGVYFLCMRTFNRIGAFSGIIVIPFIILFACEFPPADFSEYVGVNFLETHGFGSDSWVPDQTAPYLLYEAVDASVASTVGTPTLAPANSNTEIYRFEVLNLIPNGDFEDTGAYSVGATPDGWSVVDNSSGTITAEISSIGSVGGDRELTVLIDETADDISYDLDAVSGGALDGLVTTQSTVCVSIFSRVNPSITCSSMTTQSIRRRRVFLDGNPR